MNRPVIGSLLLFLTTPAIADIDPLSGIDIITIRAPGNAPWMGNNDPPPFGDRAIGRGGVSYEYGIGRFEVNTAQWGEFFRVAFDRPSEDRIPFLNYRTPQGNPMLPVGGITWRESAIYCNWLHNGKSHDRDAFLNGAYDVGTFGGQFEFFTDQTTHNPGARYWIPTWDEYLKASHYDPDKNGPGQGGWWLYNNGTDVAPTPGPPGVGEANYGFRGDIYSIPLGAYPDTQTPWGLLDTAGATTEWTEEINFGGQGTRYRVFEGSYRGSEIGYSIADSIYGRAGSTYPSDNSYSLGFRIATSVPSHPTAFVLIGAHTFLTLRRRRGNHNE